MDAIVAPGGKTLAPGSFSLAALPIGAIGVVMSVGAREKTALERRLIELGFVSGERIEILTEARPGRDPFVVRIGTTTFALRRAEVETVWVELSQSATT
ncbi:MAG TPA: FeoA family protein [Steroidobacteraceae bacterium]